MSRKLREIPSSAGEPLIFRYTQSRLCNYCSNFIQRVIQWCNEKEQNKFSEIKDRYIIRARPSDRSVEALILSAQEGCWICNHITSNAKLNSKNFKANIKLDMYSFSHEEFTVHVFLPKQRGYTEAFRITRVESPVQEIRCLPLAESKNNSTWSFNGLEKAKGWLHECNEQHMECGRARLRFSTSSYPLRLLDVRNVTRGSIRLVKSCSLPLSTRYATLSHCWGQVRQGVLIQSQLDAYSQHISTESLPRTHREAAEICADLELNYLWIDSLCIVQDDSNEWASEAPRMAEIYTNSYITPAATASRDDAGGLHRPFNPCHAQPLAFNTTDLSGEVRAFKVEKDANFDTYVNFAPLNLRAWVLQERLLSSRILHFANDQIYWQCPSAVDAQFEMTCDAYDEFDGPPYWRTSMKWASPEADMERGEAIGADGGQIYPSQEPLEVTILKKWNELIIEYCRCGLSFNSDKLIALSGLARRIHSLTSWSEKDYLAGLWRQGLPGNLLWTSYGRSIDKPNAAPSWSWASVNHDAMIFEEPFETTGEQGQNLVRIVAATTIPSNDNFGNVIGGTIRLSGNLGKFTVHEWHWGRQREWKTFIRVQSGSWKHVEMNVQFDHRGRWTEVFGRTVFVLPVIDSTGEEASYPLQRVPDLSGLMLEPTTVTAGQYRRVGHFSIREEAAYVRVKRELASTHLERNFYVERDGVDKYIIEIV